MTRAYTLSTDRRVCLGIALLTAITCCPAMMADEDPLPSSSLRLPALPTPDITAVSGTEGIVPPVGFGNSLPGTNPRLATGVDSTFYQRHLLPRLSSIMGDLSPVHTFRLPGQEPSVDNAFRDLADLAGHCFERATRKAVKSYFLETTGLDDQARRYKDGIREERDDAARTTRKKDRVRFRMGASHTLPKLDMLCRLSENAGLRLSVRAAGTVGLEFEYAGKTWTRLHANYDRRRDRYDLALRIDF